MRNKNSCMVLTEHFDPPWWLWWLWWRRQRRRRNN